MLLKKLLLPIFSVVAVLIPGSASAVVTFTETFNSGASNWLNNASPNATPTWNASGGVGNSGYISYDAGSFTTGNGTSYPGFDPVVTQIMFRGNSSADASGDAFVGDWLGSGVIFLTLSVQHNHTTSLDFYARIAGSGGAGASLTPGYTVAPNTWTEITIPIIEANPPFLSYGSSNFNGVFTNVQNLQFGFYLDAQTEYTNFAMGIDNVGIQVVPEPSTAAMIALGVGSLSILRRRRKSLV